MSELFFNCPWCQGMIIVNTNQINCRIFRHAVLKETNQPTNPHMSKSEMDILIAQDKIWGCGGPFRLNDENQAILGEWSD
jgi:hypothetical protein